jgi:hypothetical protein
VPSKEDVTRICLTANSLRNELLLLRCGDDPHALSVVEEFDPVTCTSDEITQNISNAPGRCIRSSSVGSGSTCGTNFKCSARAKISSTSRETAFNLATAIVNGQMDAARQRTISVVAYAPSVDDSGKAIEIGHVVVVHKRSHLWQHSIDSFPKYTLWMPFKHSSHRILHEVADVAGVPPVMLLIKLFASEHHFLAMADNNIVSAVNARIVHRLVFAADNPRNV